MKISNNNKKIFGIFKKYYKKIFGKFSCKYKKNFYHYMNSIFTIISYNLPWYKINNIKGFTISYSNYFRFFKKLLSSNIFNLVYSDLVKYKFSYLKNYDKIFNIDSTIIFNNNGSEEISKIPNYTKKKGSKLSIIIHNDTLIPISVSISDAKTSDINLLEKNILSSKINLKNSTRR
jgi:hypothetical protein